MLRSARASGSTDSEAYACSRSAIALDSVGLHSQVVAAPSLSCCHRNVVADCLKMWFLGVVVAVVRDVLHSHLSVAGGDLLVAWRGPALPTFGYFAVGTFCGPGENVSGPVSWSKPAAVVPGVSMSWPSCSWEPAHRFCHMFLAEHLATLEF